MARTVFQVGELIENRYRVLSLIGSGGMSTLYCVSDEAREGELVALKTVELSASGARTSESVERFRREFQILAQLRHPNVASVYNYGITAGGDLYFTMEWAKGQSLRVQMREFKRIAVVPVIVQICRALAYLHARGVIHGKLEPANVLIADGQVKIIDLGVALETRSPQAWAHYYALGYTAPEVMQQRAFDHRADLYSLGALWYALLMGEPPMFMPGSERLVLLTLNESLESKGQIPADTSAVITRLLATLPMDRYASAAEVIEAINRITGGSYELETRETAGSYALRVRFVDREAELRTLQLVWEHAQFDVGKLVLVSGEAGVGKTRLLEEFIVQAEMEGARVARGQCVAGGGMAYRPWREVLRVLIRYVESVNEAVMRRVGPVLATLLPELWERPYMAGLTPPADLDPPAAQLRLNDAMVQVLRAATEIRPTVVVIEDAHWADEATLALLTFLARIPVPTGLLVGVTCDDEIGPEHPLAALPDSQVVHIPLQPLSPEYTADLARSMLGLEELPASLMERVHQVTEGNAFFAQELIRMLAEEGAVLQRTVGGWRVDEAALQGASLPESIRQVMGQRLARVSVETQQVLRWASIVGSVFWAGCVEEIGQVSRAQVQAALGEGLEKALLVARESSALAGEREYMFTNPTVLEASYNSVPQEERRAAHGRVATWLMAHSDAQAGERLGLIADHLEKAGQTEQAVTYLRRAGEQAVAQFANVQAIAYLSRALDLLPENDRAGRYALLLTREGVYHLQGAREAQAQDLAVLRELAQALSDESPSLEGRRRAEVAVRQARLAEATGDYPAAIAAAQAVVRSARAARDVTIEAAGYLQWGLALWQQGTPEAALPQLGQALVLAQVTSRRSLEADCLRNLGIVCIYLGDYIGAKGYYERALHFYRQVGNRQREGMTLNNLAVAHAHVGDYARARSYFEEALRASREVGDRRTESIGLEGQSLLFHYLGDEQAGRQCGQQALLIAQEIGDRRSQGYAWMSLGHALAGLGQWAEAAEAYQQVLTLRRELGQQNLMIEPLAGLARVCLAQNNLIRAQAHVEEISSLLEKQTLESAEEPFLVHLTCYRVLQANQDPRAQDILNTAYRLLQKQVAKITDEEMRLSFLENVSAHREIMNEFAKSRSARARSKG